MALTYKYSSLSGDIFQAWQLCLSPLKHSSHFYKESKQSPWMLATDCVFWFDVLFCQLWFHISAIPKMNVWKTFIVSVTEKYPFFFTIRLLKTWKIKDKCEQMIKRKQTNIDCRFVCRHHSVCVNNVWSIFTRGQPLWGPT